MRTLLIASLLVMGSPLFILSQSEFKCYTLFHGGGKIIEKPITVSFLSPDGKIHDKHIQSLTVLKLDSVYYTDNNPDMQHMLGSPIPLNFKTVGDSLLVRQYSPEYYAIFVAYHTIRSIEYFDSLFTGYMDFDRQPEFANIEIFLGRYAQSDPKQYVFTPGSCPSPTIVYHEIGHRAFWQLQDTLKIGRPGDILHMGLLEYFTTSQADYPVVLEGLVPKALQRDVSKSARYPGGIINYPDFWDLYREAYKDSFTVAPAYKVLYDVNLQQMARWDSMYKGQNIAKNVIEAHRSGLIIAHPLWELRLQIGQAKCDRLVKTAMLMIPSLLERRAEYLEKPDDAPHGIARWYDFLHAIDEADESLYAGADGALIADLFKGSGFDIRMIRTQPIRH